MTDPTMRRAMSEPLKELEECLREAKKASDDNESPVPYLVDAMHHLDRARNATDLLRELRLEILGLRETAAARSEWNRSITNDLATRSRELSEARARVEELEDAAKEAGE